MTEKSTHRAMVSAWDPGGIRVSMICDGPKGSVELWFSLREKPLHFERGPISIGGLERHSKQRLTEYDSEEPSHTDCAVLNGPCWHDGGSLYAMETLIPGLFTYGHKWVQDKLEETYGHWFEEDQS